MPTNNRTPRRGKPLRDFILKRTRKRVGLFASADGVWQFSKSLKSISEDAAQEYEGRAVLELVQNGHDALLKGSTGRIKVVLTIGERSVDDDEKDHGGAFGVLYVANDGKPFAASNFEAISDLALSDKGAAEGIGNKGLGFRSVLLLSESPEVFSKADSKDREFDGFCFRFATPADVRELVEDRELAEKVITDVSPLDLPVPASVSDGLVAALGAEGFSTVVRLPLRDKAATSSALAQIDALSSPGAPLLLFLKRVSALEIEVRGQGPVRRQVLVRSESRSAVEVGNDGPDITEVDLGDQGRFLLARRTVEREAFAAVIERSIERKKIDERWRAWEGSATVEIAVPFVPGAAPGRLYTFLPMSVEAVAPLRAHVHAPFFTKLARLNIDEAVELNGFLLDELAALALDTTRAFRNGLPHDDAAPLLVDLMCWSPAERMVRTFDHMESQLEDEPFIDLLDTDDWGTLSSVDDWPDWALSCKVVSASAIAERGIAVVDFALGAQRLERLRRFHEDVQGCPMMPNPEVLADWVEDLAKTIGAEPETPISLWSDFYDDLAQIFEKSPEVLRGRLIVLDQDSRLRRALGGVTDGKKSEALFFAPDEDADNASRVPSDLRALRGRLSFTHPDIPWNHPGAPPRRRPGRRFLQDHQLVSEYRTDRLLDTLKELLASSDSDALRRDVLAFLFGQYRTLNDNQKRRLTGLGLWIPGFDGKWRPIAGAGFSPGWRTPGAVLMDRFLDLGGSKIPEMAQQRTYWIADVKDWPLPVDDPAPWVELLRSAGVKDGYLLRYVGTRVGERSGYSLNAQTLVSQDFKLEKGLATAWIRDVTPIWSQGNHPSTLYKLDRGLATISGGSGVPELPAPARRLFAEVMINGLRHWGPGEFKVTLRRPGRTEPKQDPHEIPTPLFSFLRHFQWVPIEDDGEAGGSFTSLDNVWVGVDREPPRFVTRLHSPLRRTLNKNSLTSLRSLGLLDWGDPAYAARMIREMGEIAGFEGVADQQANEFRKQCETTWSVLAGRTDWPWSAGEPVELPAVQGIKLVAYRPAEGRKLYVNDEPTPLKKTLAELAGHIVLIADPTDGRAIASFLEGKGVQSSLLSTVDVALSENGVAIAADPHLPRLVDEVGQWLVLVVGLVLELKAGAFVRRNQEGIQRTLDRLRTIRFDRHAQVELRVEGVAVSPPQGMRSLPLVDPATPTLVVWGEGEVLSALRSSAQSLAQLLGPGSLQDALENAFLKLERIADGRHAGLTEIGGQSIDQLFGDDDFVEVFGVTAERVAEIRHSLLGDFSDIVHRLRPVLVAASGIERIGDIDAVLSSSDDEPSLIKTVGTWGATLGVPAEVLATVKLITDMAGLRDELGLDFIAFNDALESLSLPKLRHPDRHSRVFGRVVEENMEALLNRLRERYLVAARSGADLSSYVAARMLTGLETDPAWLEQYAEPPVELVFQRISDWLVEHGADGDLAMPCALPAVQILRESNIKQMEDVASSARPLVRAWCTKHEVTEPAFWNDGAQMVARSALDNSGAADFFSLDRARLLAIAAAAIGWPNGMPLSTTAGDLGLSVEDLNGAGSGEDSAVRRRLKERTTLMIGGSRVQVGPEHLSGIADLISASVNEAFLKQSGKATLVALSPAAGKGHVDQGTGRIIVSKMAKLTDDQRLTIGFAGEILAGFWLQRRYQGVNWRSGYSAGRGGIDPSDGLGYDFEVVGSRGGSLMFEVKALSGDVSDLVEFELAESELRAAQVNSRNERFRILLVTSVLESDSCRIFELPNPLSARGRGLFRVVGRGLRYQCAPRP